MELTLIAEKIFVLRGQKIIFDFDLAKLYEVETRILKQAIRRNIQRFPSDFMFELTEEELENWRSQFVMSNDGNKMGLRYAPFAFTEQGVAMLSSVLKSDKAISINIAIIRAFVLLREYLAETKNLNQRVSLIENKMDAVVQSVNFLLEKDRVKVTQENRPPIGFKTPVQSSI